jgi:hypothetical protein
VSGRLNPGRKAPYWTSLIRDGTLEVAGQAAIGRYMSCSSMVDTDVERTNYGVGRNDQLGMIQQMLKIVDSPLALVGLRIVEGKIVVADRQLMPIALAAFIIGIHKGPAIISPIK